MFFESYNWAFAIAAGAMIISLLVYIVFNKTLPNKSVVEMEKKEAVPATGKLGGNGLALAISLLLMGVTTILIQFIPGLDFKFGMAIGLFVAFLSYISRFPPKKSVRV